MAVRMTAPRTVVLTRGKNRIRRFAPLQVVQASTAHEVGSYLEETPRDTLWLSYERTLTNALLKSVPRTSHPLGDAVLFHAPEASSIPVLGHYFKHAAFVSSGYLPENELGAVLLADNNGDLFIGGLVDIVSQSVTLWRGDLCSLVASFSIFSTSGDGTRPDFADFAVTDYGQTVRLGPYEASTDAILYELDPDYRRRMKKARWAREQSFGASLRRLRTQRGLRRKDFAPLAEKTILRIEQGKVKKGGIQDRTRSIIAKRLGVQPQEIESY